MTKDFADFLASLNSEGAVYVVIGGIAVLSYVPYRTTRDLDVLIEPSLENARRVRRAVATWLGADPKFEIEEFITGDILRDTVAPPSNPPALRCTELSAVRQQLPMTHE